MTCLKVDGPVVYLCCNSILSGFSLQESCRFDKFKRTARTFCLAAGRNRCIILQGDIFKEGAACEPILCRQVKGSATRHRDQAAGEAGPMIRIAIVDDEAMERRIIWEYLAELSGQTREKVFVKDFSSGDAFLFQYELH